MTRHRSRQLRRIADRTARPQRLPPRAALRRLSVLRSREGARRVGFAGSPWRAAPAQPGSPPRRSLDWARKVELASVVVLALLSPLITAAGIWYSNNQVSEQLQIRSAELRLSREGQITDRYTQAVENLGASSMDVRLGAVYSLQRIMEDAPGDQPAISNVLATYVRTHAVSEAKDEAAASPDVHAALAVLANRDSAHDGTFTLDLRRAHLSGIELSSTYRTRESIDSGANFARADLRDANLAGASLRHADLRHADLRGTDLVDADLNSADLREATVDSGLRHAHLTGADLSHQLLPMFDLSGGKLSGADLSHAWLREADLSRAFLVQADLRHADLRGADLDRAYLEKADLTETKGLKVEQVTAALITSSTKLPPHLAQDPAVKKRIAEGDAEVEEITGR